MGERGVGEGGEVSILQFSKTWPKKMCLGDGVKSV